MSVKGLHPLLRHGGHVEITVGKAQDTRRLQLVVYVVALLAIGITGRPVLTASSQTGTGSPKGSKPPTILFMCPHGAARSVLASAYFQRLAKERGLNVHVASAGTEPDATVSQAVTAHLKERSYAVPIDKPRQVGPEEFAAADVVISIGCDLTALPQARGRLIRWDDVPALSDDFMAADEAIRKRVTDLVEELVRSMPKKKSFRLRFNLVQERSAAGAMQKESCRYDAERRQRVCAARIRRFPQLLIREAA